MRLAFRIFLIAATLGLFAFDAPGALAAVEIEDLGSTAANARYATLIDELRCPQCQNQNLAASNAPIAGDLRAQVRRLLREGKSDTEIIDFLVGRYGDFVLYRPRWQPATYLLWLGPGLLLIVAGLTVALVVGRQRRAHPRVELDGATRETLTRLLEENRDNSMDDRR